MAIAIVIAAAVVFSNSTSCNDPATTNQRDHGLVELSVVAMVSAVVWLVTALRQRHHWRRYAVGGVLTVLPVLLILLQHRHTSAWVGNGFCF